MIKAERHVISTLLKDSKSISRIVKELPDGSSFKNIVLGKIYDEYVRGYDNNYDVTLSLLNERIVGDEIPADIFNDEIKACMLNRDSSIGVETDAQLVLSAYKADRAEKIMQGYKLSADGINGTLASLIRDLEGIVENKSNTTKTLSEIASEYKDRYFTKDKPKRVYLGFDKLDEVLGGLRGGDMIAIGARPAVGKSAFVTQVTTNLARQKLRIGFYNLEMQEDQVYERFLVNLSGIGLTRLKNAESFLADEEERFNKANEELCSRSEIFLTTGSKSMSDIKRESKNMKYDVLIIDYLQLLKNDTSYRGNRTAEVGAISKAIKGLAMELNIPIIVLSQLNRVSEAKDDKEPTMAEMREAGDIEQDASIVMLLWNVNPNDRTKKGLKVDKNRQGLTGKMVMDFVGDTMSFIESNETIQQAKEFSKTEEELPFK